MLAPSSRPDIPSDQAAVGLKVALNILSKWRCSSEQIEAILGLRQDTTTKLDQEQIERISYILNIHQALRIIFSNPENVYGFMQLKNHNPYFDGKAPLEIITSGKLETLREVYRRIDAMRDGQWH